MLGALDPAALAAGFVCPRCGGGSQGYMQAKRVHEYRACWVPGLGHGGDDLSQDEGGVERLVLGDLPPGARQEGDLAAATEQGDRGELSHRLADGAQDSQGHGGPGARAAIARYSRSNSSGSFAFKSERGGAKGM